jgi:hypothetical protein
MTTEYQIDKDLHAELTDNDYLLTVFSKKHDDYDTYKLKDGEWEISYDSLSNKGDAADVWEDSKFVEWAEELKAYAKEA